MFGNVVKHGLSCFIDYNDFKFLSLCVSLKVENIPTKKASSRNAVDVSVLLQDIIYLCITFRRFYISNKKSAEK